MLKGFGKLHSCSWTATDVVWSHWAVAAAAAAGLQGIVPGDSLPPPSRIADPSRRVVVVCMESLVCKTVPKTATLVYNCFLLGPT